MAEPSEVPPPCKPSQFHLSYNTMPATGDGQDYYQEVALGSYRSTFTETGNEPPQPGLKRYLCYFLHRFLEFRIPEIEALSELATGKWRRGRLAAT